MPVDPLPETGCGHPPCRSLPSVPQVTPDPKPSQRAGRSSRIYPCPVAGCTYWTNTNATLKIHSYTHTGEKPLVCLFEGCSRRFSLPSNRNRHHRTHTGEKPWVCTLEGCTRRFGQARTMQHHYRLHSGSHKKYLCPEVGCQRRFSMRNQMYKHRLGHFGKSVHVCPVEGCGRLFTHPQSLYKHKRVHNWKPSFLCPEEGCTSRFALLEHLQQHVARHARDRACVCPVPGCTSVFTLRANLQRHISTHSWEELHLEPAESVICSTAHPCAAAQVPRTANGGHQGSVLYTGPAPEGRLPLQVPWAAAQPGQPAPLPFLSDDVLQCLTQHEGQATSTDAGSACLFSSDEPFERWMDPAAPAP